MTYFSKTLNNLTEPEINWFVGQQDLCSIKLHFFPSGVWSGEYYDLLQKGEPSDSQTIEDWFNTFDQYVIKHYDTKNEINIIKIYEAEAKIETNRQKFSKWQLERNFWTKKILFYKKQYSTLGFNFDLFPNFEITKRNKFVFNPDVGFYEKTNSQIIECSSVSGDEANPIILAVFLQKFLQIWRPKQIIKFAYHPGAEDIDIVSGLVEINSEYIKMISIDDLCNDDFRDK